MQQSAPYPPTNLPMNWISIISWTRSTTSDSFFIILSGTSYVVASEVEGGASTPHGEDEKPSFDYGLRSASPSAQDDCRGWAAGQLIVGAGYVSGQRMCIRRSYKEANSGLDLRCWVSVTLNPTYSLNA